MSICHSLLDSVTFIKLFPRNPRKCNPAEERVVSSCIAEFLSYNFKSVAVPVPVLAQVPKGCAYIGCHSRHCLQIRPSFANGVLLAKFTADGN